MSTLRPEFIFYEGHKRLPVVKVTSLLGMLTWRLKTLFLDVPNGKDAGSLTMFEEQKENLYNWERWVLGTLKEVLKKDSKNGEKTKDQIIEEDALNDVEKGALKYSAKTLGMLPDKTINEMIAEAKTVIALIKASIKRVEDKHDRLYLNNPIEAARSITTNI